MAKKFENSLSDALKGYWTNYTGLGRATRAEFWRCELVYGFFIGYLLLSVLPFLSVPWMLVSVIPNFCLTVRRLHDSGRSGWNFCFVLLPVIGWVVLLYFLLQKGSVKTNQYGRARIKK